MRFLFFCCLLASFVSAQDSITENLSLDVKVKNGFLAAHRGTMGHLAKEPVWGGEISLSKRLNGSSSWNDAYKNPLLGVTAYGSTIGNQEILGHGFGVYGFIEFPMTRNVKHFLSCKLSTGLGYVTKVFDQETNPKNVATSTHFNALLCLGIQGRWLFAPKNALLYGVDLTHFSNSSYSVPNLGLNMLNISVGFSHIVASDRKLKTSPLKIEKTPFFSHWRTSVLGVLSAKEIFPTEGKKYPVYALSTVFSKRFRPKVGMELSFDLFSKQSLFAYRNYIPKTQWSVLQIGAYAGYMLPLNRLRFVLGMGVYLKDRYDADDELYHRVGMRYQFDNGLLLNLVLKSHWAKADYTEWGIGYTFNYRQQKVR